MGDYTKNDVMVHGASEDMFFQWKIEYEVSAPLVAIDYNMSTRNDTDVYINESKVYFDIHMWKTMQGERTKQKVHCKWCDFEYQLTKPKEFCNTDWIKGESNESESSQKTIKFRTDTEDGRYRLVIKAIDGRTNQITKEVDRHTFKIYVDTTLPQTETTCIEHLGEECEKQSNGTGLCEDVIMRQNFFGNFTSGSCQRSCGHVDSEKICKDKNEKHCICPFLLLKHEISNMQDFDARVYFNIDGEDHGYVDGDHEPNHNSFDSKDKWCTGVYDSNIIGCFGYYDTVLGNVVRWIRVTRPAVTLSEDGQRVKSVSAQKVTNIVSIYTQDEAGHKVTSDFKWMTAKKSDASPPQNLTVEYRGVNQVKFSWAHPAYLGMDIIGVADKYLVYWSDNVEHVRNIKITGNLQKRRKNLWRRDFGTNDDSTTGCGDCNSCSHHYGSCLCLSCRWKIVDMNRGETNSILINTTEAVTHKRYFFGVAAWNSMWEESSKPETASTNRYFIAQDCGADQFLNISTVNGNYLPVCKDDLCDDWSCQVCPHGASCEGDILWSGVRAKYGWWRAYWSSKIFVP